MIDSRIIYQQIEFFYSAVPHAPSGIICVQITNKL